MAPAHSFDIVTLEVLKELNFVAITDGHGFYPYLSHSLLFVPQISAYPIKTGFGISTICLHVNTMTSKDILYIEKFIINNKDKFIDFKDVVKKGHIDGIHSTFLRFISKPLVSLYRKIKAL